SIISSGIKDLELYERLRILSILLLDLTYRDNDFSRKELNQAVNKALKTVTKIFNKELKQINKLSSLDIISLMVPFERAYLALLPSIKISDIFVKKWKYISKYINDTDIIVIFDYIFEDNTLELIEKEIHRRNSKAIEPQKAIMDFYLAVIKYIQGEEITSSRFDTIIDNADMKTLQEVQAVSRKLAGHTSGALQAALATFNFNVLNEYSHKMFDDYDDYYDNDYDDDDDDDYDTFLNLPNMDFDFDFNKSGILSDEMFLQKAEHFVQSLHFNALPDEMIKMLRNSIRSNHKGQKSLDVICNAIKRVKNKEISREVKIFFLGTGTKGLGEK
ncbi:MAG: hypothetical protein J7K84_04715, partial [Deltaproteobacteria bacterium]|nr:hypothetical protein [Deltaproteobacteria bacterium]